jgi:hypothetical protein
MDEIHAKALSVFLLAIPSHLYSFALRFIFPKTYATSYSFNSSGTQNQTSYVTSAHVRTLLS